MLAHCYRHFTNECWLLLSVYLLTKVRWSPYCFSSSSSSVGHLLMIQLLSLQQSNRKESFLSHCVKKGSRQQLWKLKENIGNTRSHIQEQLAPAVAWQVETPQEPFALLKRPKGGLLVDTCSGVGLTPVQHRRLYRQIKSAKQWVFFNTISKTLKSCLYCGLSAAVAYISSTEKTFLLASLSGWEISHL